MQDNQNGGSVLSRRQLFIAGAEALGLTAAARAFLGRRANEPLVARADAIGVEMLASILMYGFTHLMAAQTNRDTVRKGFYAALQRMPGSVYRQTRLRMLRTKGNVDTNHVLQPMADYTPAGEQYEGVHIYPFTQALAARYDYTRVLVNGTDITKDLAELDGRKTADCRTTTNRNCLELDGDGRIKGMVDHLYYLPSRAHIDMPRPWNIEFVYSLSDSDKVSVLVPVQPRTHEDVIAEASSPEAWNKYMAANAPFTATRATDLTLRGVKVNGPVELMIYDSDESPGSPRTFVSSVVLQGNQDVTIKVSSGPVLIYPTDGSPDVWFDPGPKGDCDFSETRKCHDIAGQTTIRVATNYWNLKGGAKQ